MFFHALLVDARQRRDGSRGTREFAYIFGAEQQRSVSAPSAFVDVHQLLLHIRQLGEPLQFQAGESIGSLTQRLLRRVGVGGRLFGLLGLEVTLDLQFAQIADERSRFAGETLCLTL
jgi:hypothetical protein